MSDQTSNPPLAPSTPRVIVEYDVRSGEHPEVRLSADVWDELYRLGREIVETRVEPYSGDIYERLWPGPVWACEVSDIVAAALAAEHMVVEASKTKTNGTQPSPDPTMAAIAWYQRLIQLATDKMVEIARESRRDAMTAAKAMK